MKEKEVIRTFKMRIQSGGEMWKSAGFKRRE